MSIGLHVGELQRVTAQLEADLDEISHYETEQRESFANALSDLSVRFELARIAVLGGSEENPDQ